MTADDDREPTQAEIRKYLKSFPTYQQQRTGRIFKGATRTYGGGGACRMVWEGPLKTDGTILPVVDTMGRKMERRRAVYRLKYGFVAKAERIVAVCGSDRCLDHRHLHIIPPAKLPTASRPSRAKAATTAAPSADTVTATA